MDIEDADDAERALTLSNPVLECLEKVRAAAPQQQQGVRPAG
jgi:hypothetical protein